MWQNAVSYTHLVNAKVVGRYRDEFVEVEAFRADYMDISPRMVVSVATAMIPFLENDDANRALMGSCLLYTSVAACDYVAGMTDHYAVECYKSLFIPKAWNLGEDVYKRQMWELPKMDRFL